jgi:serine kinase of HPr protein (carbohydrate metabolism regulator)
MTILSSETLHASCVAIGDRAVLIEGPSGSGKSDLALRLIDRGAVLVSDDYTIIRRSDGRLLAVAPPNIAGLIEVRGIGLVPMPFESDVPVALLISLSEIVERLPDDPGTRTVAGIEIPVAALTALEASAPLKVEILLNQRGIA